MRPASTKEKSFSVKGEKGPIVTGSASKPEEKKEPISNTQEMDRAILNERAKGEFEKKRLVNKSWNKPGEQSQFIVGQDTGLFAWLTPMFCEFFGCHDVGYKKNLRLWNFPPALDNPKKKHEVYRQYFYKLNNKYVLVDAFDDKTPKAKIDLIKAWLESMGYAYTYIIGGDFEKSGADPVKFADLIFGERLAPMKPKAKDYPKFKVPTTYEEAGMR